MSVRSDAPQQPGFLLRLWIFLVKLAYSFTGLFKSNAASATSTTLPSPVTAGSLATHHRWLRLVNLKFSNALSIQKNVFASQSHQVLTATETHQDFVQSCPSNDYDGSDNRDDDLVSMTYTIPGFIGGTVSPARVSENDNVRVPTPFSTLEDVGRPVSITSVASGIIHPNLSVSSGVVSVDCSPINSFLTRPLLGIPRSIGTPPSLSESICSVSVLPLTIRRGFSGSVRIPDLTIRLESPWSPSDKTLPLDVWMDPKGILVNAHGPLCTAYYPQAEAVVCQYMPYANLRRAPSSWSTDDEEDSVSLYSYIVDPAEEGYVTEESSQPTSQEYPVSTIVSSDKCSPPNRFTTAATSLSTSIQVDLPVIAQISIPDATQVSTEDTGFKKVAPDHTSSELDDSFSCVISLNPGLACIPSLKHKVRSLSSATNPLRHTDRAAKYFSIPYLSIREPDRGLLVASTSSFPKSFSDAVQDRKSRALADLISLLDLTALQTAETIGVSEIRMGDYAVRAT